MNTWKGSISSPVDLVRVNSSNPHILAKLTSIQAVLEVCMDQHGRCIKFHCFMVRGTSSTGVQSPGPLRLSASSALRKRKQKVIVDKLHAIIEHTIKKRTIAQNAFAAKICFPMFAPFFLHSDLPLPPIVCAFLLLLFLYIRESGSE